MNFRYLNEIRVDDFWIRKQNTTCRGLLNT